MMLFPRQTFLASGVFLTLTLMCASLQAQWVELSVPEDADHAWPLRLVIGPDQRPWLMFADVEYNTGLSVARLAEDDATWEFIGPRNLYGSHTGTDIGRSDLIFDSDDRPWLIYRAYDPDEGLQVAVRAWNEGAQNWDVMGNPINLDLPGYHVSDVMQLAFDSHGHPVVAFRYGGQFPAPYGTRVYWLDTGESDWQMLADIGTSFTPTLRGQPGGELYFGLIEEDQQLWMRRLRADHSGWDLVGGGNVSTDGVNGSSFDLTLDAYGRAHVLYHPMAEGKVQVLRLAADENSWEQVGPDVSDFGYRFSLRFDVDGRLYAGRSGAIDQWGNEGVGWVERLSEDGLSWEAVLTGLELFSFRREFMDITDSRQLYYVYMGRVEDPSAKMKLLRWTGEIPSMIFSSRFEIDN